METSKVNNTSHHLQTFPTQKTESSYLSRIWKIYPSSGTVLKLALVTFSVLAVSFIPCAEAGKTNSANPPLIPSNCLSAPRNLSSMSSITCPVSSYDEFSPLCEHGFKSLPLKLSNFMHNEKLLVTKGHLACKIEQDMSWANSCDVFAAYMEKEVKRDKESVAQAFNEIAFAESGTPVSIPLDSQIKRALKIKSPVKQLTAFVGNNPKKMLQHQKAVSKTENFFLGEQLWYEQSDNNISSFLKDLHRTLHHEVASQITPEQLRSGKYRNEGIVVKHNENIENDIDSILRYLKKDLKATPKQIKLFHSAMRKSFSVESLTSEELAVSKMLFFLPPQPKEIPSQMKLFISTLKEKAHQNIHPIELAGWAHCEIGRIHPFSDGNGRIARLLMNGILTHHGYRPLSIPNDQAYTQAVNAEAEHPGTFANYLATKVIPWNEQQERHLNLID